MEINNQIDRRSLAIRRLCPTDCTRFDEAMYDKICIFKNEIKIKGTR